MIDFTNCIEYANKFEGSEKKKTIEYQGKIYLLKFPDPTREKNKAISYINNTISEYIGCKIYESVGIDTQQVLLGIYRTEKNDKKIVCACEDFTGNGKKLYEYKQLQLANVESTSQNALELTVILEELHKNDALARVQGLEERFWDQFVLDTFIGNQDRHTGNWGFLGTDQGIESLAPVFDCGSCLSPLLSDDQIQRMEKSEYRNNALNVYSCYRENGRRIHAPNYLLAANHQGCNDAVKRIVPEIDMDRISNLIAGVEEGVINENRKNYYMKVLGIRYEDVLKPTFEKVQRLEKERALDKCMERTAERRGKGRTDRSYEH